MKHVNFDVLRGKTLVAVDGGKPGDVRVVFRCSDGSAYLMYHEQDCCERVEIEDTDGDLQALVGSPLLQAEEGITAEDKGYDHQTWTFYRMANVNNYATIRWLGESNGYYSEHVDFVELHEDTAPGDHNKFRDLMSHNHLARASYFGEEPISITIQVRELAEVNGLSTQELAKLVIQMWGQ